MRCSSAVNGIALSSSMPMYGKDASRRESRVPWGMDSMRSLSSLRASSRVCLYTSARVMPSCPRRPRRGSASRSLSIPTVLSAPCSWMRLIASATSGFRPSSAATKSAPSPPTSTFFLDDPPAARSSCSTSSSLDGSSSSCLMVSTRFWPSDAAGSGPASPSPEDLPEGSGLSTSMASGAGTSAVMTGAPSH